MAGSKNAMLRLVAGVFPLAGLACTTDSAATARGTQTVQSTARVDDQVQPGRSSTRPQESNSRPAPIIQASDRTPEQGSIPGGTAGETTATGAALNSAESRARLSQLRREATARFATIDSYIARLRRREQVQGKDRPEETILVKFRKQPWSIYFKWLGKEGEGREVIYVKGHYEDKIHTLLAAGDMPFARAGQRIALSPDSLLVRSSSRRSIREAGIGNLVERCAALVESNERDPGLASAKCLGRVKRAEFPEACEAVEQVISLGADPLLPKGGRRLWIFDPTSRLPVLIQTYDDRGHEVEYYCYDRLQYPVKLDEHDFDPDKLWPNRGVQPGQTNRPGQNSSRSAAASGR